MGCRPVAVVIMRASSSKHFHRKPSGKVILKRLGKSSVQVSVLADTVSM